MQSHLQVVKTALRENRPLSFSYADGRGNQTARIAEPYQLVLKSGHWYVQGYCRMRRDYRLFRLSRMSNLQLQAETFPPREYQKPILDFADVWETMRPRITLRIHPSAVERALDFCTSEDLSPDGGGHYIVRFPFLENDFYYNILLSFGGKCECLEPPRVRAELRRRVRVIAALSEG